MLDTLRRFFKPDHQWVSENLSAYLDDELTAGERAQVESHLAACEECQAELEELRYTINLIQSVPEVPLPRSFLVPLSEAKQEKARASGWAFPMLRTASAIATFAFVLVLSGNLLFQTGLIAPAGRQPEEAPMMMQQAEEEPSAAQAQAERAVTVVVEKEVEVAGTVVVEKEMPVEKTVVETVVVDKVRSAAKEPETPTEPLPEMPSIAAAVREAPEATPEPSMAARIGAGGTADLIPPPTVVAEAERTYVARPEIVERAGLDTRQRIGAVLEAAMWVLLLATVALWGATALMSRQRP